MSETQSSQVAFNIFGTIPSANVKVSFVIVIVCLENSTSIGSMYAINDPSSGKQPSFYQVGPSEESRA